MKREIYTLCDEQSDPSKNAENFQSRSSFDEMKYIKNITRLLDSLNNNRKFCPI